MFRRIRTAVTLTAVLVFASASCRRADVPPPDRADGTLRIGLDLVHAGSGTVDVLGLPPDDLSRLQHATLTRDDWTKLLRVAVAGDERGRSADRPAVLGTYAVRDGALSFAPQFPFDPGRRYEVVLDPSRLPPSPQAPPASWRSHPISASITVPGLETSAPARVVEVYPTAREVPENQLRLYIQFSAPMGLESGLAYVHLLDETGRAVVDPFLPLDLDLWNRDRTRFTVLFDPGRVKRGVLPNEQMGRSITNGRKYTLVVDADWRDARGQPLASAFRREFRAGPAAERPIEPLKWRLEAPPNGVRDPLIVWFPQPLDYGLLLRALSVRTARGERVEGEIRVEAAETRWLFIPSAPWRADGYLLVASSILEDVAGNRIGRPFEVDALTSEKGEDQAEPAAIPFRVGPRTP